MPYNPNNTLQPTQNMHGEIFQLLDKISTYLFSGEIWHEKAANECRKVSIRGYGRWHEAEGMYDSKERFNLDKLLRDKLQYSPKIDFMTGEIAYKYTINNSADFKSHHSVWIAREQEFVQAINSAIVLASPVDMELYKKLCHMVNEVQNEIMRVRFMHDRLELAGWSGHDIGICSMKMHNYFEKVYDGGEIDLNLG